MNRKLNLKVIGLVVIFSVSLASFTGCGAKKVASTTKASQNGAFAANMKQRITDAIKPLVDDKTITIDQSNKIVEGLSANTGNFSAQRPSGQNGQGTNPGGTGNGTKRTPSQGGATGGANAGGGFSRQGNLYTTGLSKLVSDKAITQAQADKVSAKLTSMARPGIQQGTQNQQSSTTS
ncbi:MAG TPA: hypothetical protein VIK72_11270 [Clostridiaceae bacterium]